MSDEQPPTRSQSVRELSFMGPSNDGKRLLLVADDGTQFELPVDSRLVSVVSREHSSATPTYPVTKSSTMPSPREIQDQVRHGATVEEIAANAGVSPDDVAKFAYPVITERAHIAEQAREALVRIGTEHISLDEAVLRRIKPRAVDPRLLRWDAWRSEGHTWTVIAAYPANQGERLATFQFNSVDKSVTPRDDEARWMLEVGEAEKPSTPQRSTEAAERPRPHVVPAVSTPPQVTPEPPPPTPKPQPNEPSQSRTWDRAHPAARAHERREATAESRGSEGSPEQPAPSRVNPEHPAAGSPTQRPPASQSGTESPPAKPSAPAPTPPKEETPQWEELLFGSPQHDDQN